MILLLRWLLLDRRSTILIRFEAILLGIIQVINHVLQTRILLLAYLYYLAASRTHSTRFLGLTTVYHLWVSFQLSGVIVCTAICTTQFTRILLVALLCRFEVWWVESLAHLAVCHVGIAPDVGRAVWALTRFRRSVLLLVVAFSSFTLVLLSLQEVLSGGFIHQLLLVRFVLPDRVRLVVDLALHLLLVVDLLVQAPYLMIIGYWLIW